MIERNKKYLLINIGFVPEVGGSYRALYEIAIRFPKGSIDVITSKSFGDSAFDSKSPLTILRSKLYTLADSWVIHKTKVLLPLAHLLIFIQTAYYFKKKKYNLLITGQSWTTGYIGWLMKKYIKCKYATFIYGEEISTFQKSNNFYAKYLFTQSVKHADIVIANSNPTKELGINFGIPENKLYVVHPGADTNVFRPNINVTHLKQKYKINTQKVVMTISRLTEQKGHDMVIKALPLVVHKLKSIIYVIVGNGPEKDKLIALSKELNLQKTVLFAKDVKDAELPSYYNLCDIFIMPNRIVSNSRSQEGFGMVFIEANACGKPVIGGNTGGATDAIVDRETGFLVNPIDTNDIANKLIHLLDDDKLALALGRKGHIRANKEFSWEVIADRTMAILAKQ